MGWLLGSKNKLACEIFKMRRYWIEKKSIYNDTVIFKDDLYHHIFDVCRQEMGHHFEVITEDSKAYLVEVTSIQKKSAEARIIETREIEPLEKPHIHIALSIPRYPVMDSTLERAVEMGVTSILPFVSSYSFIRKEKELPAGKTERWQKIVISATQQSGRGELMKVHDLTNWTELFKIINPTPATWCLFAYEGASVRPIQEELKSLRQQFALNQASANAIPSDIWLIVGSEGGFSTQEAAEMQTLGLHPVTLGRQILRVETACLTLVSVLKYEFGLMK